MIGSTWARLATLVWASIGIAACSQAPAAPPVCQTDCGPAEAGSAKPPELPEQTPQEAPGVADRDQSAAPSQPVTKQLPPTAPVMLEVAASDQAALIDLDEKLEPLTAATAETLLAARPVTFESDLGYDPKTAVGLSLIQESDLALTDPELAKLSEQGFAISPAHTFADMAYGLKTIYYYDLPVYISIDAILDAVHNAYKAILKDLEISVLSQQLETILSSAHARNAAHTTDPEVKKDLDFYFSVALSLLRQQQVAPIAGADPTVAEMFARMARAAEGIQTVLLFGEQREIDFSQFKERGHYIDSKELGAYFKALIWLGRTDFRLIETLEDGSRLFHRRQLNATLAMRDVLSEALDAYQQVDATISMFAGEHDYMELREIDKLLEDLGVSSADEVAELSDQKIAQTIIDRGYGAQRIMSQVIFKDRETFHVTLPLDRSFVLFGQRYSPDAHVLSDVVYDRVLPKRGAEPRYLPDALDAAYAALGNSAALPLLRSGLDSHGYAPQLERARTLIDGYESEFWQENLYNLWLSALRALSPAARSDALPSVARSEAWSRRILNTQLASWAQLRHDTMLYVKQSYSAGGTCEFPDAYVDPYPEAFAQLALLGQKGKALTSQLTGVQSSTLLPSITSYFGELESVANILRDMAQQQQKGVAFNEAQMAFINAAVGSQLGCGGPATYTGWYARLMYRKDESEMDPIIADVHTDPGGNRPAKVMHVATGLPRLMVVTVNNCNGPRAYAGVAYSYHELTTEGVTRLNDIEWEKAAPTAVDVPWMESVLPARTP